MGGLFTGSSDGKYPGLAGLKESGELMEIVKTVEVSRKGLVNSSLGILSVSRLFYFCLHRRYIEVK
jgi:hypothetical protein